MENVPTPTKTVDGSLEKYIALLKHALETHVFREVTIDNVVYQTIPPEVLHVILTAEYIKKHFVPAFTDPSFDFDNSYESPETIGDLHGNAFQGKKIRLEKPNMTPAEISNMLAHYKSNREYGKALRETIPNVGALIRTNEDFIKEKVYADIFEALLCAIEEACASVLPGIGMTCSELVFLSLTRNIKLEDKYAMGSFKTIVDGIFGKQAIEERPKKKEEFNNELTVTIHGWALDEKMKVIRGEMTGRDLTVTVKGVDANDRQSATANAYEQILAALKLKKFTPADYYEADRKRIIDMFKGGKEVFLKEQANNETVKFVKSESDGMTVWRLLTVDNVTGKRRMVGSITTSKNPTMWHNAKNDLLTLYLVK